MLFHNNITMSVNLDHNYFFTVNHDYNLFKIVSLADQDRDVAFFQKNIMFLPFQRY